MTHTNIPYLDLKGITAQHGEEIQRAVAKVVGSGWYLQGESVGRFEENYAKYIGTKYCVGVGNGLDALILTLRAYMELGHIEAGDEVIVPANTFIATVLAITENGLTPVFVDVDAVTLEMSTASIEKAVTEKTKALMMVHLYGRCVYRETIAEMCREKGILIIEDNAQAHGCIYNGRRTGSLGNVGCHSFYPGKNLGALGDGGAVTTDDADVAQTIRTIANYGFAEKYVANQTGKNSRLDEIQAAVLDVKLRYLDDDNRRRKELAHIYYNNIEQGVVRMPQMMNDESNVYHIFPIFTERREELQAFLNERGIQTLIHYPIPPHKQRCYAEWNSVSMPVAERLAKEELSLPLNQSMTDEEATYIAETINTFTKIHQS